MWFIILIIRLSIIWSMSCATWRLQDAIFVAQGPSHCRYPPPSVACHGASSRHVWSSGSCRRSPGRTASSTWATKRQARRDPQRWHTPAMTRLGQDVRHFFWWQFQFQKYCCAQKTADANNTLCIFCLFSIFLYTTLFVVWVDGMCGCSSDFSANSGTPWSHGPWLSKWRTDTKTDPIRRLFFWTVPSEHQKPHNMHVLQYW